MTMRSVVISAGAALAFCGNATLADDYKELTDASYCIGVVSRNIDLTQKMSNSMLDVRDQQQHLARKTAFVEGAMKLRKIDTETVNKLIGVGRADAQLCWDNAEKCAQAALKRGDIDLSERMVRNCERPAEAVCKRIEVCN
jgi:hypothetical protein